MIDLRYLLQGLNIIIVILLTCELIINTRKSYKSKTQTDYAFYKTLFTISFAFLIANIAALYNGHKAYFVDKILVTDDFLFIRYLDRFCMFIGYVSLVLFRTKTLPSIFKKTNMANYFIPNSRMGETINKIGGNEIDPILVSELPEYDSKYSLTEDDAGQLCVVYEGDADETDIETYTTIEETTFESEFFGTIAHPPHK